ncbi:MAG: hypothetical protein M0R47_16660 [Methylobacter sp.]|uniref:hypothetical protein n=1 Tax=Methylobacter sp. TaxID=2051955 RepID=UPI0025D094B3|nr:hypothetical protein [Methylobacter sp.]MCK9622154.1 hypothetical protein [Methylobacter sp.]
MPFKNQHPLYSVWKSMKSRCLNKRNKSFHRYGGRGITVCDSWVNNFHAFVADMGERPKGFTLERIDNQKGYFPENCKWASRQEQQINRDVVNRFFIDGVEIVPALLAKDLGLKSDSITNRVKKGLSIDEILLPHKKIDRTGLSLGGKANGARQRAKTHCPNGHEYKPENLIASKEGWRRCKICHREKERQRTASRKNDASITL